MSVDHSIKLPQERESVLIEGVVRSIAANGTYVTVEIPVHTIRVEGNGFEACPVAIDPAHIRRKFDPQMMCHAKGDDLRMHPVDKPCVDCLGFDPTNHHNAAKCPYCMPTEQSQDDGSEACALADRIRAWRTTYIDTEDDQYGTLTEIADFVEDLRRPTQQAKSEPNRIAGSLCDRHRSAVNSCEACS